MGGKLHFLGITLAISKYIKSKPSLLCLLFSYCFNSVLGKNEFLLTYNEKKTMVRRFWISQSPQLAVTKKCRC